MFNDGDVFWYLVALSDSNTSALALNTSGILIYLSPALCQLGSDDLYDCFGYCNETAMFSSLPKLHNCMMGMILANISAILDVQVQKVFAGFKDNQKLLPTQGSTNQVAISFMVQGAVERTSEIMQDCFFAGLRNLGRMQVPNITETNSSGQISTRTLLEREVQDFWDFDLVSDDLCGLVSGDVNPDVGSIGVRCLKSIQRPS